MIENYYNILGIPEDSSTDDIKKAFKKLAIQYHPDKGGNEEKFKEINNAYQILSNDKKRNEYDNIRKYGNSSHNFQNNFNSTGNMDFDDILKSFFKRSEFKQKQNNDISIRLNISLEDAFNGKSLEVSYSTQTNPQNKKNIVIDIPAGIENSMKFLYAKKGDDSIKNIDPGDLYVTLYIIPHPIYNRNGQDLIRSIDISFIDLLIGTTIELDTIDGTKIKFNIPENSKPTQIQKIPKKGMKYGNNKRGDLYIQLNPVLPKISDNQKTQLKKIFKN